MAEGQTHLDGDKADITTIPDPKCSCCDKRYKNPIYLLCGHTINRQCILRQKSYGNGKCVICKKIFNVKEAEKFHQNYFLERLSSVARSYKFAEKLKEVKPNCKFDDHADSTCAIMYCSMCKIHFCKRCKKLHDKIPEAQKHEVFFAETESAVKDLNDKFQFCKEHQTKKISSWCSDCKLAVCDDCCVRKHKVCSISSQAEYAKTSINKMYIELEKYMSTIKSNQNIINENEKHLGTSTEHNSDLDSLLRFTIIRGTVGDISQKCLYLKRDIQLLTRYGSDIEIASNLEHLNIQWENISTSTNDIDPRPDSSSSSERSSISEVLYMNEMIYEETEVCMRKPVNKDIKMITQKLNKFDVEFRITGMTLLDDVIVVVSRSAGLCAGYSYEAPGIQKWIIREKLNGPFDLDSYQSEKDKHYLFISDPGQTDKLKGAVRVYERQTNARFMHFENFTTECHQPKGICVYANKVYICESEQRQVTEYNISPNLTGNILKKYNEPDVLKEPMYVAVKVINERVILIISDNQIGLKRLVKGEDTGSTKFPPWAVSMENTFTPSKCSTIKRSGKSEVFVGNSSGRNICLIDFESRQVNHREYSLEDGCFGPVAVAINDNDQAVIACKDGTVIVYQIDKPVLENNMEETYANIVN